MTTQKWALAAAVLVLVLSQQACSDDDTPVGVLPSGETVAPPTTPPVSASASTSASPSASSSASASASGGGDVLSGKRQVAFVPLVKGQQQAGSVISVTPSGKADVTNRDGDEALFVPVPTEGGFLLKTGKLKDAGQPLCLEVKANGSNPLTVVTSACKAGEAHQRFSLRKQGESYLVSSGGVFLQWRPTAKFGLIAQEAGDGEVTRWHLADKGAATI